MQYFVLAELLSQSTASLRYCLTTSLVGRGSPPSLRNTEGFHCAALATITELLPGWVCVCITRIIVGGCALCILIKVRTCIIHGSCKEYLIFFFRLLAVLEMLATVSPVSVLKASMSPRFVILVDPPLKGKVRSVLKHRGGGEGWLLTLQ